MTGDAAVIEARPLTEWSEDDGPVLWWRFPVQEPPYVGTPLDIGQTVNVTATWNEGCKDLNAYVGGWPGYHTHWTPIEVPVERMSEPELLNALKDAGYTITDKPTAEDIVTRILSHRRVDVANANSIASEIVEALKQENKTAKRPYASVGDWLYEIENHSSRAERMTSGEVRYARIAWQLATERCESEIAELKEYIKTILDEQQEENEI